LRDQHTFVQPRKDLDSGDENKLVERSGIGYNSPHLDAEFAKRSAVALEIFDSVLKFDAPGFRKASNSIRVSYPSRRRNWEWEIFCSR